MKILLFSFASLSATSGGIFSVSIQPNIDNTSVKFNLNNSSKTVAEISTQNIAEISSISNLKTQNAIPELVEVVVEKFVEPKTTLDTYYSSKIFIIGTQPDITTETNAITSKQNILKDILAEQIKLSNTKQTYSEVKQHFENNVPTKNNWEMVEDTTKTPVECKIQQKSSGSSSPSHAAPNNCSYDWNILSIDVNDKIKVLLTDSSVTPTPQDLTTKFNKILTPT